MFSDRLNYHPSIKFLEGIILTIFLKTFISLVSLFLSVWYNNTSFHNTSRNGELDLFLFYSWKTDLAEAK